MQEGQRDEGGEEEEEEEEGFEPEALKRADGSVAVWVSVWNFEDYYEKGDYIMATLLPGGDRDVVLAALKSLGLHVCSVAHQEVVKDVPRAKHGD
jgi:hypothetical protein